MAQRIKLQKGRSKKLWSKKPSGRFLVAIRNKGMFSFKTLKNRNAFVNDLKGTKNQYATATIPKKRK